MRYTSTRDKNVNITAKEAIFKGLSKEGGLFVPARIPKLSAEELAELAPLSYVERAMRILTQYLSDFSDEELEHCVKSAYTKEKFETEAITPIYKLDSKTYVLELWHGPTCAFKDLALQILPRFLTCAMNSDADQKDKTVVILTATSGDTGKAALEGFKDVEGTKIMVFYPQEGVSNIQKLQMNTSEGENVYVYGVLGNFDDAQNGVKAIFTNQKLTDELNAKGIALSSANSINWGRLAPQIVYYISCYCDLIRNEEIKLGEKINIAVPTGNFGNILAACYAMWMGVPINRLICASNQNNVLTDFVKTGLYNRNRQFYETISPSMDILISSNLERLLYHLSINAGLCNDYVVELMKELSEKGCYQINSALLEQVQSLFYGGFANDDQTLCQINKTYKDYGYGADTHTAVALKVYEDYVAETGDKTKTVIASTASVFKFAEDVARGLELDVVGLEDLEIIEKLSHASQQKVPKALKQLKNANIRFDKTITKNQMEESVRNFTQ